MFTCLDAVTFGTMAYLQKRNVLKIMLFIEGVGG